LVAPLPINVSIYPSSMHCTSSFAIIVHHARNLCCPVDRLYGRLLLQVLSIAFVSEFDFTEVWKLLFGRALVILMRDELFPK
jgi:hypothetical protein